MLLCVMEFQPTEVIKVNPDIRCRQVSPALARRRLAREWQTISAMVQIYCRAHKHSRLSEVEALCPDCQSLLDYAAVRLDRCRFGTEKPTCARCPVHCYIPMRREQVRAIMRYSGPRMVSRHPILSLWHWLDSFRQVPSLTQKL